MYGPRFVFFVPLPIGGLLVAFLVGWAIALPVLAAIGAGWLIDRRKAAKYQRQELFGPRHPH